MKHFIFVDDYEINPKYKAASKKRIGTITLAALCDLAKRKKTSSGGGGTVSFNSGDKRQNCVVKMNYSYSIASHIDQIEKYIKRDGVGKNSENPKLFGVDETEYKQHITAKNIRIFISPANPTVPLETLTKKFIEHLELHTGYSFYWVAGEHHNTDNSHVHILINGKDKKGKDVFIPRDVVKTVMREFARDLCTSLVGERTKEDIKRDTDNRITSNRFCIYDTMIMKYIQNERVNPHWFIKNKEVYIKRLSHLEKMHLCKWDEKAHQYVFEKEWDETLRVVGRYNMFLEAKKSLQYTDVQNYQLYDESKGIIQGIVTKIYRLDENSDNHAAVIESIDGKAYFVPLYNKPKFKENHFIVIKPVINQKGRLTPHVAYTNMEKLKNEAQFKGYTKGFAKKLFSQNSFEQMQDL